MWGDDQTKEIAADALKQCWPFDSNSKVSVEMMPCSGGLPKDVTEKVGYDHGTWPIMKAEVNDFHTSHAVGIADIEKIRDKVKRVTGFTFQWLCFEIANGKAVLSLEFANFDEVKK
jgi:hypothetical protein